MEKLIELLNEWSKTAVENKCNWTDVYDKDWLYFMNLSDRDMTMEVEEVISKTFWFIKWLVDNDKINTESWPLYWFHFIMSNREPYSFYETLLMLLAISDTPIEDLISYLK